MPNGVLCIGAVMADALCRVPALPGRGEGVLVSERTLAIGGCAFNSASAVLMSGAPCVLAAPLGHGIYGRFLADELAKYGLSAMEVPTDLDSGLCTCLVEPDGERTMITAPGVERTFEESWFEGLDTSGCSVALASGYEISGPGGAAIIHYLEKHPELEFFYGPGPCIMQVGEEKHARINALCPVWHLNDLEALTFTGAESVEQAGAQIAALCGNACVITCGADGSRVFFAQGESLHVPSRPTQVVDTVGAGDTHLGALAANRAAGRSWEESLAAANNLASAVCEVAGGTLEPDRFAQLSS